MLIIDSFGKNVYINDDLVGDLCFDDVTKSATSQIIYDLVRTANFKIDQDIIDLLTIALITDTGRFRFVKNSGALLDAASLVDAGATVSDLNNIVANSKIREF